jgi:putative redox protein
MPDDIAPTAELGERVLVAETRLGRLQVTARTAHSAFLVDEPRAVGGLGSGPDPYELLAAALGACTAMTLRLYAERKGLPLERVQVCIRHKRASLDAHDRFERTITLEGPLDEEQRAKLLTIAERCPVHRTLERGSDIATALSPSEPEPAGGRPEHMRDMEQVCA